MFPTNKRRAGAGAGGDFVRLLIVLLIVSLIVSLIVYLIKMLVSRYSNMCLKDGFTDVTQQQIQQQQPQQQQIQSKQIQQQPQQPTIITIPHEIPRESRADVSAFLTSYMSTASQVCAVQGIVVDGIAKTEMGLATTGPNAQQLAAAQKEANTTAGSPLFDCITYEANASLLSATPLTIQNLYNYIDDIPDNFGDRMLNSAKFSAQQLQTTYDTIQGTLAAATAGVIPTLPSPTEPSPTQPSPTEPSPTQGFTDIINSTIRASQASQASQASNASKVSKASSSSCKPSMCPEEMGNAILERLPGLQASLTTAIATVQPFISTATDLNKKLQVIKEKAQSGTLIGPSSSE